MSFVTDLNDKLNLKQFTEPKLYQSAGAADATWTTSGTTATLLDVQDLNLNGYDFVEFAAAFQGDNATGGGADLNLTVNLGGASSTFLDTIANGDTDNIYFLGKIVAINSDQYLVTVLTYRNGSVVSTFVDRVAKSDVTSLTVTVDNDATLGATFTATNLGGWAVLDTLSKA